MGRYKPNNMLSGTVVATGFRQELEKMLKPKKEKSNVDVVKEESAFRHAKLSPRETEVGARMLAGMSDAEISAELGSRPGTVEQQRKSIYRRLGVSRRKDCIEALRTYFEREDNR